MATPAKLESRAKNAGFDVEFHKQIMKLEELKELVKRGDLKEEVYKQLEDQVFKMKEKPAENSISPKKKQKGKGKTFARRFLPKKTTEKLKTLDRSASRSRGGSVKSMTQRSRADSAKSFLSAVSERAKSAFKGRDVHNVLLEAEMMKFVKTRTKKKWAKVYTILYTDRVEFKNKKEGKVVKTVKLNEDFFVSTVDEKGAKKVVQRAVDDEDSLESEDEEQIEQINENLEKMDEIMVMNNVFVIASLGLKRKQKVMLACESDELREIWVAMTCQVIRDLRELAHYGESEEKFSKKGWTDINGKAKKFAQVRLGKELEKDVHEIDAEKLSQKVTQWESQGKKVAKKQFMQEWRSREAQRMREQNKKLKKKLVQKEEEFDEFKVKTKKEITEIKTENQAKLEEEKQKNVLLNKKYDELMEKYRAEAYQRNMERKNKQGRLEKRIKALQRRSTIRPGSEQAEDYITQLEEMKAKLAVLQKALKIDLDEMDWDGSLEQAEERMQECLKIILEGDPKDQQKAQADFDKWDQLVRSHKDYILREENKWKDWEADNFEPNLEARNEMRDKFVPEKFKQGCSVKTLMELKGMKEKTAQRIFKNKIFKFLWMEKDVIAKLHIAALNNDYASQGLDLRELRAIYASLPLEFDIDGDGKKKAFRDGIRSRLYALTEKKKKGQLKPHEEIHNDYRDKAVKINRPTNVGDRAPRVKRKPGVNSNLMKNAAALEAFFGKGAPPASGKPNFKLPSKTATTSSTAVEGGGESNAFDPFDKKWDKYIKMQRMLPDGAIEQKMMMNRDDPKLWNKIKEGRKKGESAPTKEVKLDPNAREFKKYFMMRSSGIMDEAIKNRMVQDDKDPELWDKLVALKDAEDKKKVEKENKELEQELKLELVDEKETTTKVLTLDPYDPIWSEYFRMKKLKLSEGQIMNKMQKDGRDPALWGRLCELKEKADRKKAPAAGSMHEFAFALETTSNKKDDSELKNSSTKVSGGTEEVGEPAPEEDMMDRAKNKLKAKEKKKKKRKKKSKSVHGGRGSRRHTNRESKTGRGTLNLLQKDAGDLVGLATKNLDLDDSKMFKTGRGFDFMDYNANTNRDQKRGSVKGRRKTLRKSKVGTKALKDDGELQKVIDYIQTDGDIDEKGRRTMIFGKVSDEFVEIADVLVGLLLKGKKGGHIDYAGDMLFQGIHDEVTITVL